MELQHQTGYKAMYILETPDDGVRYQVVDGELYMTAAPIPAHQYALMKFGTRVDSHVDAHRLGVVFPAPTALILDEHNGVEPDLLFVGTERRSIIRHRAIEGAPDLIVEILSPSTRRLDPDKKLHRYAAAGIPHYWIVDVDTRRLYEYRLTDGRNVLTRTHGPDGVFEPDLFPGLSIEVSSLWL